MNHVGTLLLINAHSSLRVPYLKKEKKKGGKKRANQKTQLNLNVLFQSQNLLSQFSHHIA